MAADPERFAATLTALHAQAAAQAERFFGDTAAPVFQPPRRWRAARRPGLLGMLALVCVVAAGLAWRTLVEAEVAVAATSVAPPRPATAVPPTQSALAEGSAASAAMPGSLQITHDQGLWRVEARGGERLAAARQLADLNGLPLLGDVGLLAGTRPLTASWQGRDAAFAWQAVLAEEVRFELQCRAGRCQAWILSAPPHRANGDVLAPGNVPAEEQVDPSNPGAQFH